MLRKESEWIGKILVSLRGIDKNSVILNIGSSTKEFFDDQQPYLKENVLEPLSQLGWIINVDIKDSPGVDLVENFLEENGRNVLKQYDAKILLVSNLLEHVPDPYMVLSFLKEIISKDSYLILTGPRRYPYHPDPIDNMFRPSKKQLNKMLRSDFIILQLAIVGGGSVLTSTGSSKKVSYKWLMEKIKGRKDDPVAFRHTLKNALSPASAFCVLLLKK